MQRKERNQKKENNLVNIIVIKIIDIVYLYSCPTF